MSPSTGVQGITEHEIAEYLAHTPAFFERHAELLASIQLSSPHGTRAVSLQERQMELLRERLKASERKWLALIRHGQDNEGLADRLHRWTCALLRTPTLHELPGTVVNELKMGFLVPQAALRLWSLAPAHADLPHAAPVSEDARSFADSLHTPFCGANPGFEAVQWLHEPAEARSVALIALRDVGAARAFGLLVLASPEPSRFAADQGRDFLQRIGELASAALSRLR